MCLVLVTEKVVFVSVLTPRRSCDFTTAIRRDGLVAEWETCMDISTAACGVEKIVHMHCDRLKLGCGSRVSLLDVMRSHGNTRHVRHASHCTSSFQDAVSIDV
jgi:hypothetical protein